MLDTISQDAVIDNTASAYVTNSNGVQFNAMSSNTNGKGVYIRTGTQNDAYPIYYYRGDVDNNNVLFGDFCWKIVRTTNTGGVKLIYNGELKETFASTALSNSNYTTTNDATYPFVYDSSNKTWTSTMHTDSAFAEISFSIPVAGDYLIDYVVSSEGGYDKVYFYRNSILLKEDSGANTGMVVFNDLTASDIIKVKYEKRPLQDLLE